MRNAILLASLAAALLASTGFAQINMGALTRYTTGIPTPPTPDQTEIRSMDIGDIDQDGDIDVVIADIFTGQIAPMINDGQGGFTGATPITPAGTSPRGIVVADIDANGLLDIVVSMQGTFSLEVFVGTGNGNFVPSVVQPIAPGASEIAVGDINSDGVLDVVAVGAFTGTVAYGDGVGGFSSTMSFATNGDSRDVAIRDLNGDFHPDVLIANYFGPNDGPAVAFNDGLGGLLPVQNISLGPANTGHGAVEIGDIDLDGDLDGVFGLFINAPNFQYLANDGAGNFSPMAGAGSGTHFFGSAQGDFDLDGDLDYVFADLGGFAIAYFQNELNGFAGAVIPGPVVPVGASTDDSPQDPKVADLNGDLLPDVVFAIRQDNQIAVSLNQGASASLPNGLARGDVSDGFGGFDDVLLVDGQAGGVDRRVDLAMGQPASISMSQPLVNGLPSAFMVWAQFFNPQQGLTPFVLPFGLGTSALVPYQLSPASPELVLITNNFGGNDPQALVPSFGTPWNLNFTAASIESYLVVQGLIEETPGNPKLTNAILIHTF